MDVLIKDIVDYLNEIDIPNTFIGNEFELINGFSSLEQYKLGTVTWLKSQKIFDELIEKKDYSLIIATDDIIGSFKNIITTKDPKNAFFSVVEHFFDVTETKPPIGKNTYIGPDVKIGNNVRIGHNCSLDGDITIGDNTIIWNNVSIINKVIIGSNVEIQSGVVIGHDGFGYTENSFNRKKMIKHYGRVVIGNNVLISCNVCIDRGTIGDTTICDGCKIDNLSHIAHNCYVGENTALAFPCSLGGSSKIEKNGYVAGGIIRNQCVINENGFVGMGAVVTKDVPADTIVIGNPAKKYSKK